jgi:hypothetical protein
MQDRRTHPTREEKTMNARESMDCAARLRGAFRTVVILADRAEPVVKCAEHFSGPAREACMHTQVRTARGVTAGLYTANGQTFATGDDRQATGFYRLTSLRTCCRCDTVTSYEIASAA